MAELNRRRWGDEVTAEDLVADFAPFVERLGYRFNSDSDFVADVLEGVMTNLDREGDTYCPCRLRTGDMLKDNEIICPCIPFNREQFAALGKCWCGLFVRFDSVDDAALLGSVPEFEKGTEVQVPVVLLNDLPDNAVRRVKVGRKQIALARLGEEVFALSGVCRHAGGQLGEGFLDGRQLVCPSHGWRYDVVEGTTDHPDSDVRTYPVEIRDDVVLVTVAID